MIDSSPINLPELPDDEELRTAHIKLVGAAHYCRFLVGQVIGFVPDENQGALEAFLTEHHSELKKAEDIMVAWAERLGLDTSYE